jgi:dTDP-4-dehydrorhamnose reductase
LKILLTGKNGQVGWELARSLAQLGDVIAHDRTSLDLSDADRICSLVRDTKPAIIVNAAAYTAVDKAESDQAAAHAINAQAPRLLAEEARKLGALLVHYSTDYVFDGTKPGPYVETDATNPVSVYGRSKREGELAILASGCRHLIFRTSWVFGPRGGNFLLTMLRLAGERTELKIVDDQFGAPTSSAMIADATARALRVDGAEGLFHLTASGRTSWCGFAREIFKTAGLPTTVAPIPSVQYPTPARRPHNSALDCSKLIKTFGLTPPAWEDGMSECLTSLGRNQSARQ